MGGVRSLPLEDAAIYLINHEGHAALVEAGCGDGQNRLLTNMEADILCEGHFGIHKGKKEVADFIKTFLAK